MQKPQTMTHRISREGKQVPGVAACSSSKSPAVNAEAATGWEVGGFAALSVPLGESTVQ